MLIIILIVLVVVLYAVNENKKTTGKPIAEPKPVNRTSLYSSEQIQQYAIRVVNDFREEIRRTNNSDSREQRFESTFLYGKFVFTRENIQFIGKYRIVMINKLTGERQSRDHDYDDLINYGDYHYNNSTHRNELSVCPEYYQQQLQNALFGKKYNGFSISSNGQVYLS